MDASTGDGAADSPIDAVPGTLFADPPIPIGAGCPGLRGYPGLPMIRVFNSVRGLALADVSGDGKPDLVFGTNALIGIAVGAGDGTFATPTYLTVPTYVTAVRVLDVDGNGNLDVVFGMQGSSMGYALNTGSGGFGAAQAIDTTLTGVHDVGIADVNADGKPDLLALSQQSPKVAVMLKGASSFGAAATHSTGTQYAFELAAGDVTGDGRQDIVVATSTGVAVFANATSGLGAPVAYSIGEARSIVVRDVSGDGKLDIVAGTGTSAPQLPQLSVLLNQGSGTFAAAATYPAGTEMGFSPNNLAVADLNGDSELDIVTAGSGNDYISVLLGAGSGAFGAPKMYFLGLTTRVALADFEGDGRIDFAIDSARGVRVFSNTGMAVMLTQPERLQLTGVSTFNRFVLDDTDDSGTLDAIVDDMGNFPSSAPIQLAVSSASSGTFATTVTAVSVSGGAAVLVAADLDNDARRDVIRVGGGLQAAMNHGTGSLTLAGLQSLADPASFAVALDVNNDSIRDVVLGATSSGTPSVYVARGLGDGNFAAPAQEWSGSAQSWISGMVAGDINGDSIADIVFNNASNVGASLVVLLGAGGGAFAPPLVSSTDLGNLRLRLADVDGDHHPDLLSWATSTVAVSLGAGDGTFSPRITATAPLFEVRVADVNGDSKIDLVGSDSELLVIVLGRGDGTFDPPVYYDGYSGHGLEVTDLDGDGQLDVVQSTGYATLELFRGRCL
jgi:hypothetical protein